nr:heme-binding domain-containing protein [Chryseobacterium sp. P1-3]
MKHVKQIRILPIVFLCILAAFIALQFFNAPIEQRPVTGPIKNVPKEVTRILERSCYDCHSNAQHLTFLDKLAPISWIVNKDIRRAREVMNFSEWDKLSAAEQKGKFYAIFNMVRAQKMPLPSYAMTHTGAKLSQNEIETIKQFALSLSEKDSFIPVHTSPAEAGRKVETLTTAIQAAVPVSPNGISYNAEFKNWKVIGMSTLIDNSIRVIYGNDIAVQAIQEENFHPWPDGSAVAKAVFKQTKKSER